MAWLAVLLIVFTHATSDAINITRDFVATTKPPTECCIDGDGKFGAKDWFGCHPGSHKILFSEAFGSFCTTDKWKEAKKKAVKNLDLDEDLLKLVDWFANNHHTYVHKGADVVLADMVKTIKNEELDATPSSTRLRCCVKDDGTLSAPDQPLGEFGPAYCVPGSHKIRFSSAFGTSCSTEKWNKAKTDAVGGLALDNDLLTLVDWFEKNHHKYVHEGADVVLKGMVGQLKVVHDKRKQALKESTRVAKEFCGETFEFDADSQDLPRGLAKTLLANPDDIDKVNAEAEASLMELPGCELAKQCTQAFRAVAGKDDTWADGCESLANSHTKCFKQVKKTLNETYVVKGEPNPKPRAEWWFGEAYPLGHSKEGNKQAREMLEKIGTLKARAAAFEKLAITNGDGNCVGSVPFYKAYDYYNLEDLPEDVGSALSPERAGGPVGDNDHEDRLRRYMYED